MWQHAIVPIATGALLGAAVLLLILASLRDIATRIVPNAIPLALAIIATLLAAFEGHLGWGLFSGALVFAFAFLCWRMHWIGGADVKMAGAAAILVPPASAASFVLATSLAGGALAVVYLVMRTLTAGPSPVRVDARHDSLIRRVLRAERWRIHRGCPLPYACAIATGALLMLR
ncbi:MAG: prepilin peptidase [Rhodospirillales bacterium]|nr:prepilin peptidase [Rhodospirillales bacterium]